MNTLPDFNKQWDYNRPAETEAAFRALLPRAIDSGDVPYLLELQTQIARSQGLQRQFAAAHATLDAVEQSLNADTPVAHVRYLLERGRVYNSSSEPLIALPFFRDAVIAATTADCPKYAADALHMVAIAEPDPKDQITWNQKTLDFIAAHPECRSWREPVYNNLGEAAIAAQDYPLALDCFEKIIALQSEKGKEPVWYMTKDLARGLRLNDRAQEGLTLTQTLLASPAVQNDPNAIAWVLEERDKCLLALGRVPKSE